MINRYSSDIILKWNDIRTKFGYNLLYAIMEEERLVVYWVCVC